ncbi:hypothetical protein [Ornithinimicrobium cerasi]|uniref:Uncharacterized protein n=1 Tax=Ornithinimicrobium cerasi TaxID=2248773 RepID=A0A285VB38_9MICO|nr:hypothetical protein [Ornithinimicrobium cerasi]SOC51187.1 hypothetical protein SAMN05421879_10168 [Ornithinimicrobium cerasi]
MSVAAALGLTGWDCELLTTARSRWDTWNGQHTCLDVGVGLEGLRQWSLDADPPRANEVLLALAELGAPDGGGEAAATGVLLWVLMPGAVRLSRALSRYGPDVDEVVAAQMWICARTVAWRNRVRVAPSVLLSARRGVLLDLQVTARWADAETPSQDMDLLPAATPDKGSSGAVDLVHELLADARRRGVVSGQDCRVLLDLAEHATTRTTTLCRAGLLSRAAAHQVAREHGTSRTTVFRRAHRALEALQATYADRARTA